MTYTDPALLSGASTPEWLVVECDRRVTCFFNVDVDQEDEDCPPRDTDWPQCLDLNEYE